PGHADDSVTVHLGYGRTRAGRVGNGTGFNAYALRTSAAPWSANGLTIRKTGRTYTLACVQMHHAMEGRDPVQHGTQKDYAADEHFLQKRWKKEEQHHQRELVPGAKNEEESKEG